MALPSSPPPSSPPLLPEEPDALPIRPSPVSFPPSRKRQLDHELSDYGSMSSDPVFSEGASEADDERIVERSRRKRVLKGPWFNLRRASTQSLRRSMAKRERLQNVDSGIWLGSDVSEDGVDGALPSQHPPENMDVDDQPTRAGPSTLQTCCVPSPAEALASRTINRCLDTGKELIDITDLGLTELSDSLLKPLHQLIRHAHTDLTAPPSEDEFGPLTPSIQLFLAGNRLTSLPSELFKLTNISVLSLRNNELSYIPPNISQLSKLKELNIAQNSIKWLPWDMFELLHCRGHHKQITLRPNPLVNPFPDFHGASSPLPRPKVTPGEFKEHLSRWGETNGAFFEKMKQWYSEEDVPWTMRHELELRLKLGRLKRTNYLQEASRAGTELKLCREQLVYLASSAIRYFNVDGSPCIYGLANKPSAAEMYAAQVDPYINVPPFTERSSDPSLFELALRSIQSTYNLRNLCDLPEDLPPAVAAALRQAAKGTQFGNDKCSVCGKHFIIARAEWMEFWFNGFPSLESLTPETVVPLLRRVCCWACATPNEVGAFRF